MERRMDMEKEVGRNWKRSTERSRERRRCRMSRWSKRQGDIKRRIVSFSQTSANVSIQRQDDIHVRTARHRHKTAKKKILNDFVIE